MSEKTKILFVLTDSQIGGTEKVVAQLMQRLAEDFERKLVVLKPIGTTGRKLIEDGFYVNSLGLGSSNIIIYFFQALRGLCRLIKIVKKEKPDIVHGFLFQANIFSRLAGKMGGAKINISSIRVIEKKRLWQKWVERMSGWMVDYYLAVSRNVEKWAIAEFKITEKKIRTIYNGIEPTELGQGFSKRKEFNLEEEHIVVGTVARLDYQKGIDCLIKAFGEALKEEKKLRLLIIGDGEEREELILLARKLGIESKSIFAGRREDGPSLINDMDIFVLPSRWEGMPNALLEAMAFGKPIIATRVGGVEELIRDGEEGIIVSPGDVDALYKAILKLLEEKEFAKKLGERARKRVIEEFQLEKMIKNYEEFYKEVIT